MFGRVVRLAGIGTLALALATCSSDLSGPPTPAPEGSQRLALAQAEVLFGAAFIGFEGLATLYTIDPTTGVATPVGPIGFERVSGMDFHPSTDVLYATAVRVGTSVPVLITINPATGAGTEVGPTGMPGSIADVSFRPDGTLFALDPTNSPEHKLWTVNLATGAGTLIGVITGTGGSSGNGIAHDASGATLFHSDEDNTRTLDQSTAAPTILATVEDGCGDGFSRNGAADLRPLNGVFYAIRICGLGFPDPSNTLITFDYLTGDETVIGATTSGMDALAWGGEALTGPGTCVGQVTSPGVTSFTFNGVTTFIGTSGSDIIGGTDHVDMVIAKGGDDTICTWQGPDVVDGGPDDDLVFGGTQNDRIFGKEGHDHLHGEAGQDRLDGGHTPVPSSLPDTQPDICEGGPHADRYFLCETIIDAPDPPKVR